MVRQSIQPELVTLAFGTATDEDNPFAVPANTVTPFKDAEIDTMFGAGWHFRLFDVSIINIRSATTDSVNVEPYVFAGDQLIVSADGGSNQTFTIEAADNTAAAVATRINLTAVGFRASDTAGAVTLTSNGIGYNSSLRISGAANAILGFSTDLVTNARELDLEIRVDADLIPVSEEGPIRMETISAKDSSTLFFFSPIFVDTEQKLNLRLFNRSGLPASVKITLTGSIMEGAKPIIASGRPRLPNGAELPRPLLEEYMRLRLSSYENRIRNPRHPSMVYEMNTVDDYSPKMCKKCGYFHSAVENSRYHRS